MKPLKNDIPKRDRFAKSKRYNLKRLGIMLLSLIRNFKKKQYSVRSISILGCGWLGLPLAKHLIQCGYHIKGSTTTPEKILALKRAGVEACLIQCVPEITGDQLATFFKSDILFLNIPFKRDLENPGYYQRQIDSVVKWIESSTIRFVIFASSTSIYPEDISEAREDWPIKPHNARAKVLLDTEKAILKNRRFKSTVVRFSGLYGGERQIGQFLAGKKDLEGADQPVNLIHLDDCVGIVSQVIQKGVYGEIFNAVSDVHPTRKQLYTAAARHLNIPPPQFLRTSLAKSYKVVSNRKIKDILGYTFRYPDPMVFEEKR